MARITGGGSRSILKIEAFLGLNENPDGDTTLKTGELARMDNFRITRDRHLQIRPGTRTILDLSPLLPAADDGQPLPLRGLWQGEAGGRTHLLAVWGGHIRRVDLEQGTAHSLGTAADAETTFFPFGDRVYLLNGQEYLSWDGGEDSAFQPVEGYIPLIQTATSPAGSGTLLEQANRLTGKRRVQFSPDGEAAVFRLPEQGIDEVLSVTLSGEAVTGYTAELSSGTLTLSSPPAAGTNTMEVTYRKGTGSRSEVEGMRFCELYNGAADTRVFLYGDGSSRTLYSGIPRSTGRPSADYFPALYEVAVGESNTPITALVRHYSRLMAFKPNSAWVIQYGTMELAQGGLTAAFTVLPMNRQLGNGAPGQAKLLENDPLTVDAGSVYQWRSSGYLSGGENDAKRISDRAGRSLRQFTPGQVKTFNLRHEHEFWFLHHGTAAIFNYANDSWYIYTHLPFTQLLEAQGEIYGFCPGGRVVHFSRAHRSDDGTPISCYAATGAMDFDRDWLLKYSPLLFVAMQPETNARVTVTVETNRRSDHPKKTVAYSLAAFAHVDFHHFSFSTNRKPQVSRVKMKVKKATFYRLIFQSNSASATATVLETDVQLRFAGNVK